jgi:hypothetical protein
VTLEEGEYRVGWKPVEFTRVRPGQTLVAA